MNRCLFVATDGSPAGQSALSYALDFAAAFGIHEIACLCVHSGGGSLKGSIVPAVVGAEMALGNAAGGLMLLDEPDLKPALAVDPESVLDACSRAVTAAGFRFTPVCGVGVPSEVIVETGHMGEAVFLGRSSDPTRNKARHLGFTASHVLQTIRQTVVVCPAKHARVQRLVLALAGGQGDGELVARGATWAASLKVPVHVAVSGSGPSFSAQASRAAQTVLANEGLATSVECYSCRPEEYAETLRPADLLLVARSRHWRVLQFWFGSNTERILERAAGPVAVFASP